MTDRLKKCPCCGGEVTFHKFCESVDGRGNKLPSVTCVCGLEMKMTYREYDKLCSEFNFKGGYISKNKRLCNAMNQNMIDKWNTRKPMNRIVEQLEELHESLCPDDDWFTAEKVYECITIVKGVQNDY